MKYYKNTTTGDVYAYTQDDLDAAAGIAKLEFALTKAQAALDALPEPTDTDEPDTAREAAEAAVEAAQHKLDDVLPVFFDIRDNVAACTLMTPEEVEAHLNPPPVPPTADEVRAQRDALLADTDWTLMRAIETGEPAPTEWSDYRQALRDVPEQAGFPESVEWPECP